MTLDDNYSHFQQKDKATPRHPSGKHHITLGKQPIIGVIKVFYKRENQDSGPQDDVVLHSQLIQDIDSSMRERALMESDLLRS